MTTKCEVCPLRRRDAFAPLTKDAVRAMQRFKVGEMTVDAGTPLMLEGSNSPQLYTALRGMGLRSKTLQNGRRQVVNLVFPGDFLGLQAALMGEMGHSIEATTKMTLCVFDRTEMWSFFRQDPERAYALTWLAAVDEHFLGETITTLGQRDALQSIAWALVKIYRRGKSLGMVADNAMTFPYKQQDLADTLGLSLVHTNKTLTKLREMQCAVWSDGVLQVNDLDKLSDIGMVDPEPAVQRPIM
ncbi:MAG: Crp/Fnr family transcriptional regulator [Yoonia sp.]|uniref:Crp/Fnr family transcriptional regulator n=1 Tax=Yoonia sp. TaxID=2212373 RepID=UPI003297F3D9